MRPRPGGHREQHAEDGGVATTHEDAGDEQGRTARCPLQRRHDPGGGVVRRHRAERQREERELRRQGGDGRRDPRRFAARGHEVVGRVVPGHQPEPDHRDSGRDA